MGVNFCGYLILLVFFSAGIYSFADQVPSAKNKPRKIKVLHGRYKTLTKHYGLVLKHGLGLGIKRLLRTKCGLPTGVRIFHVTDRS